MVRSFLLSVTLVFLCSIFSRGLYAQGVPAIFLHTDKGTYFPGDTVWFKGYVLNEGLLDETLKNLYIDWGNSTYSARRRRIFKRHDEDWYMIKN